MTAPVSETELRKRRQAQMAAARAVKAAKLKKRQEELERAREEDGMGEMQRITDISDDELKAAFEGEVVLAGDGKTIVVFSTKDGIPSRIRIEQLASKLMPDDNGDAPFSEKPINPDWKYKMDNKTGMPVLVRSALWKCMLHPEHPKREYFDSIGLSGTVCRKDNLPSAYALRQHMQMKHTNSWNIMREAEEEEKRDEDRRRQEEILKALAGRG